MYIKLNFPQLEAPLRSHEGVSDLAIIYTIGIVQYR